MQNGQGQGGGRGRGFGGARRWGPGYGPYVPGYYGEQEPGWQPPPADQGGEAAGQAQQGYAPQDPSGGRPYYGYSPPPWEAGPPPWYADPWQAEPFPGYYGPRQPWGSMPPYGMPPYSPPPPSPEQELAYLKDQEAFFQEQLEQIRGRISELSRQCGENEQG